MACGDGEEEEFDRDCLVIGNLDNSIGGEPKIAIGSLTGLLRIYMPSKEGFRSKSIACQLSSFSRHL